MIPILLAIIATLTLITATLALAALTIAKEVDDRINAIWNDYIDIEIDTILDDDE